MLYGQTDIQTDEKKKRLAFLKSLQTQQTGALIEQTPVRTELDEKRNFLRSLHGLDIPKPEIPEMPSFGEEYKDAPSKKAWSAMGEYLYKPAGKAVSSALFGLPEFIPGVSEALEAETPGGAVAGAAGELVGFLGGGPMRLGTKLATKGLSKFAPKLSAEVAQKVGGKGLLQSMAHGGAALGIASGASEIAPSIQEHGFKPEVVKDVAGTLMVSGVIGSLFPPLGVVKSKPARVAVGMALMDGIRGLASGQGMSTIDDITKAYKSGELDNKQLAESAFGYMLDMYFSYKTPTMAKQLAGFGIRKQAQDLSKIKPGTRGLPARRSEVDRTQVELKSIIDKVGKELDKGNEGRSAELYKEAVERSNNPQLLLKPRTIITPTPSPETVPQNILGMQASKRLGVEKPFEVERPGVDVPKESRVEYLKPETPEMIIGKAEAVKRVVEAERVGINKAEQLLSGLEIPTRQPSELIRETLMPEVGKELAKPVETVTEPLSGEAHKQQKDATLKKIDDRLAEIETRMETGAKVSDKDFADFNALHDAKAEIESISLGKEFTNAMNESVKGIVKLLELDSERGSFSWKDNSSYGEYKAHFDNALKSARKFGKGVNDVSRTFVRNFGDKIVKHLNRWKKEIKKPFDTKKADYESNVASNQERIDYFVKEKVGRQEAKEDASYDKVIGVMEKSWEAEKNLNKWTADRIRKGSIRETVDKSGNIKKGLSGTPGGQRAIQNFDLARGADALSRKRIKETLTDIVGELSPAERKMFAVLVRLERNIQIEKNKGTVYRVGVTEKSTGRKVAEEEYNDYVLKNGSQKTSVQHDAHKFAEGVKSAEHKEALEAFARKSGLSPERLDLVRTAVAKNFEFYQGQIAKQRDRGEISQDFYNALAEQGDYTPNKAIDYMDSPSQRQGGKNVSVGDVGIKKMDEGSYRLLLENPEMLIKETIAKNTAIEMKNKAARRLYELAETEPDNGIVRLAKVKGKTLEGKPTYEDAPIGFKKIYALIDGAKKEMIMPQEFANEWVTSDPLIAQDLANVIGWVSGKKILQFFATGAGNPLFGAVNIIRDPAHAYLVTDVFSEYLPKYTGQMVKRMGEVSKDAWGEKGQYADAVEDGMMMDLLTDKGKLNFENHPALDLTQRGLTKGNRLSEIIPRLAIRRQVIMNEAKERGISFEKASKITEIREKASWEARNYIDFQQSGRTTQAVGTSVAYLNAGIQGTRGIFRAAKKNPDVFMSKVGQLALVSAGLYLAGRSEYPDEYDKISKFERKDNFIIPTSDYYTDKDGNTRRKFIKIPKDQGQRLIGTLTEAVIDKMTGEEVDVDMIVQSAKDLIAILPTSMIPPTIDGMLGFMANHDFWRDEDIWRLAEVKPEAEAYQTTSPALKKIGEVTGQSPVRMKYFLEKLFTSSGIFTTLVGGTFNEFAKILDPELDYELREKDAAQKIYANPLKKRFVGYSKASEDVEGLKEAKLETSTESLEQNQTLERLLIQHFEENKNKTDVIKKYISLQQPLDQKRLLNRVKMFPKLMGIPNRSWWMALADNRANVRARIFYSKFAVASEGEKKKLLETLGRLDFISSKEFKKQLSQIIKKEGT